MFKILKYQSTFIIVLLLVSLTSCACTTKEKTAPLPAWNEGTSKTNIIEFVQAVTDKSSPDYVPPTERIATFDNIGTLWSERPVYFQLYFAIDRIKQLAPQHLEWQVT
ncbi:MAG TPA: hypothetical protein EYQ43_01555 [Methyloprofundus sp.]|uniref:hypothetical protein n=1 Tax=Methyloprofundus sp. TaxID=2020875 RepID=UPI0017DD105C|nr:hypothetical protein [Methyloprofundus sp.]HIG64272.1 hypothetical protein [Methyloprofundus sp.]HIL77935.1 hypothetical protein [Methylococcales bacterium]